MTLRILLKDVNSWNDFKNVLESKSKLEKGKAFEELTKYYLHYNPVYKSQLKNVWLHSEITPSILKKLNIPSNDQGIDIIAETYEGKYWAIQCKYLQDEDQRLSHRAISTFVSLSTGIAENITYCLVCTTVDEYAKIYQGKENIGFCNSDEWRKLDKVFFEWVRNKIAGKENKLIPYTPKEHQIEALKEARQYFTNENNSRGKLVFPCGAGKSLTGYWITKELNAKNIIVAVPSLSLIKQTLEVYLRESVANSDNVEWLCVCSDQGIGKNDDVVIHTNEIGVPCITNKTVIADWLIKNQKKKTIIFTTYQSGKTMAEACKIAKHSFNLGIMDEAHKTVGEQDKLFSHLLFEKNINIDKRIFMTATERRYAGSSDTILSMDDVNVYGETFAQMSFKQAIEIGILSDYKIVTLFISNAEVQNLIEQNAFVKPVGKEWDRETEARTLAALIALRKAMTEFPIHHAVTFHSSIKKAVAFEQSQSLFNTAYPNFSQVKSYHVSGAMPTAVRGKIVDEFASSSKGIITNAKCLTEGIDVPNIDCVLFADPRKSTVDIVQAVGRALRIKEGKKYGYVILPVFTNSNNTEEIIESVEFKEILNTIRALASNDERIIEYFKDFSKGVKKNNSESLIQFDIDEKFAEEINIQDLTNSLQLKAWNRLSKLSWMLFEEAREYVKSLNIKTSTEWHSYLKLNKLPLDVPLRPDAVYKNNGWQNWGHFLSTGNISNRDKKYLTYDNAKKIVHKLNLKSSSEYKKQYELGNIPLEIPLFPSQAYENKGWENWGKFLGTDKVADHLKLYKSFEEARIFVRNLGLKSANEWLAYCKAGLKPDDIPSNVHNTYKNKGWNGIEDFLGLNFNYLTFIEAKEYVQKLKFTNSLEWRRFCTSGNKPKNIPSDAAKIYKNEGWKGMKDFLGPRDKFINYKSAKKIIEKFNIKSKSEWDNFCKSDKKPDDIPYAVEKVYENNGWVSWGEFLGTGNVADNIKKYRAFTEVKKFVHNLNLRSQSEWKAFAKTDKKPLDIPSKVERTYASEWINWADFLGKK